jgi:hypothetical protein
MKLSILLTFCLEFVVCKDQVIFNYIPIAPLDSGSAQRPIIYQSAPAVSEKILSEGEFIEKAGNKDSDH